MFAYCEDNPVKCSDEKGLYNQINTRNYCHSDGGTDWYYGTGPTKSKKDRELLQELCASRYAVVRSNCIVKSITVTKSSIIQKGKSVIRKVAEAADNILEPDQVTIAKEAVKILTTEEPEHLNSLTTGFCYDVYSVTVIGYEQDSLTKEWIPFSETTDYALKYYDNRPNAKYYIVVDYTYRQRRD